MAKNTTSSRKISKQKKTAPLKKFSGSKSNKTIQSKKSSKSKPKSKKTTRISKKTAVKPQIKNKPKNVTDEDIRNIIKNYHLSQFMPDVEDPTKIDIFTRLNNSDEQPHNLKKFGFNYDGVILTLQRQDPKIWNEILDLSFKIKEQRIWEILTDNNLFGIEDPETHELYYCRILGKLGTILTIQFIRGPNALRDHFILQEYGEELLDEFSEGFIFTLQDLLSVSFEDKQNLNPGDIFLLNNFKQKKNFKGKNGYPVFQSFRKYFIPWGLDDNELRIFRILLEQAFFVFEKCKQNKNIIYNRKNRKTLIRKSSLVKNSLNSEKNPQNQQNQIEWHDEYVDIYSTLVIPGYVEIVDEINHFTLSDFKLTTEQNKHLNDLAKMIQIKSGFWEIESFFYEEVIQLSTERPVFPFAIIIADKEREIPIIAMTGRKKELLNRIMEELIGFVQYSKWIPKEIHYRSKSIFKVFRQFSEILGIRMKEVDDLDIVDELIEDFLEEESDDYDIELIEGDYDFDDDIIKYEDEDWSDDEDEDWSDDEDEDWSDDEDEDENNKDSRQDIAEYRSMIMQRFPYQEFTPKLLKLKITLDGLRPPLWRRILIPNTATFFELHDAIQYYFDWDNYHLHEFTVRLPKVKIPEIDFPVDDEFLKNFSRLISKMNRELRIKGFLPDGDFPDDSSTYDIWETQIKLGNVFSSEIKKVKYTYDFGDNWEHTITLEEELPMDPKIKYPVCIKGKNSAELEDMGGPYGWEDSEETFSEFFDPGIKSNKVINDLEKLQNKINRRLISAFKREFKIRY